MRSLIFSISLTARNAARIKQVLIAQNMLCEHFFSLNITPGTLYHGSWVAGRVERNRRIYDYEFVFFSSGSGRVITEDTTYFCRRGSVIIIPPGQVHCTIADAAVERWCIHFDWFGTCRAHREKERIWVFLDSDEVFETSLMAESPTGIFDVRFPFQNDLPGKSSLEMFNLLESFFRVAPDTLTGLLRKRGLFLEILSLALNQFPGSVEASNERLNPRFFQAKSSMDSSFAKPEFGLAQLAGRLRITPNHLTKLFRQKLGMSALDYLQNLRLQLAAELLRENSLNIQEVAQKSGFANANYFTRIFRLRHGLTPTAFRRMALSTIEP